METINYFYISLAEATIIAILVLLIVFRKIGRPLSESEIQERKKQKVLAEEKFNKEQQLHRKKLIEQEKIISELIVPVKLVSVNLDHFDLRFCVVDKSGKHHAFKASSDDIDDFEIPRFETLYIAAFRARLDGAGAILIAG